MVSSGVSLLRPTFVFYFSISHTLYSLNFSVHSLNSYNKQMWKSHRCPLRKRLYSPSLELSMSQHHSPHAAHLFFTVLLISHTLRYKDWWFHSVISQTHVLKKRLITSPFHLNFMGIILHESLSTFFPPWPMLFPYSSEYRKCSLGPLYLLCPHHSTSLNPPIFLPSSPQHVCYY